MTCALLATHASARMAPAPHVGYRRQTGRDLYYTAQTSRLSGRNCRTTLAGTLADSRVSLECPSARQALRTPLQRWRPCPAPFDSSMVAWMYGVGHELARSVLLRARGGAPPPRVMDISGGAIAALLLATDVDTRARRRLPDATRICIQHPTHPCLSRLPFCCRC